MSQSTHKPVAFALLAGGIALAGSAFAMQPMAQGYLLSAAAPAEKAKEGSCGGDKKAEGGCGASMKSAEGKCGEGKCGIAKADTDKDGKVSRAEFDTAHPNKAEKFAGIDTNKDGFIDAAEAKAHKEGKCGEGKCGGDKKAAAGATADKAKAEGKCGEGKCGGSV
jgi:uncharacterized low-complexity protein